MLQRAATPKKGAKSSRIAKAGSFSSSAIGKEIDAFLDRKDGDLLYEIQQLPDGQKVLSPKNPKSPNGLPAGLDSEKKTMGYFSLYWEPLLHDLAFLEEMRDNISLIAGAFQKFTDLVMEGFHLECEDPANNDEINDLMVNDPTVDFAEIMRNSIFQLATIANAFYVPEYVNDDQGFRVSNFRPVRATAMRKLRDENLKTLGYVQLLHRPAEIFYGGLSAPTFWNPEDVCCGIAYSDGWYAYGKPPLAALPFVTKMKLQMERDMIEMLHQHVPRIDVTYTPDQQMNDESVQAALTKAGSEIGALKPTDNYIHTPDFTFEYKGPNGKALEFSGPLKYVQDQMYAILPLLSAYLSGDLNINPITAQQAFRVECAIANMLRQRVNVMFAPMFKRVAQERDLGSIKAVFTDLDAETAEITARTQEYQSQNAASNRDNGFIDQDTAAQHATVKSPGGKVKKAAEPAAIPPPAPALDPNKQQPSDAAPPSKGGKSKVGDSKKGPKAADRSAPTPDKRPRGKRHEDALTLEDRCEELLDCIAEIL